MDGSPPAFRQGKALSSKGIISCLVQLASFEDSSGFARLQSQTMQVQHLSDTKIHLLCPCVLADGISTALLPKIVPKQSFEIADSIRDQMRYVF